MSRRRRPGRPARGGTPWSDGLDVTVTVETEPQPPHVLLLRGRVSITEVDGMVPEQAQAARRFPGEKGGAGYLAQAEHQDGPYHAASHVGGRPGLPDAASGRHEGRTVSRSSSSPTAAPATSRTASPLRRAVPGRIVDNDSGDETLTLAGSRPPTRGWSRPDATQASPTAATRTRSPGSCSSTRARCPRPAGIKALLDCAGRSAGRDRRGTLRGARRFGRPAVVVGTAGAASTFCFAFLRALLARSSPAHPEVGSYKPGNCDIQP